MFLRKTILASIAILLLTMSCTAKDDKLTVNVATMYGPRHWQTIPIVQYAEAITERSNGNIQFVFHFAGSLLGPSELVTGTGSGIVEMAGGIFAYTPDRFPVDDWLSKLGFLPNPAVDPPLGPLVALAAPLDWSRQSDTYQKEFLTEGVKVIGGRIQPVGDRFHLMCRTPVTTLAEAKGKRVRVGGPAWAQEVKAVGMIPVSLPGSEIYESLQRGIVDCNIGNVGDTIDFGLLGVAKHFMVGNLLNFNSFGLVVNARWWGRLPKETQALFEDELPTYLRGLAQGLHRQEISFRRQAVTQGVTIHEMAPDLSGAIDDYHVKVLTTIADEAPASVKDPQGMIDSYVASFQRWVNLTAGLGIPTAPTYEDWIAKNGETDLDLDAWEQMLRENLHPLDSSGLAD